LYYFCTYFDHRYLSRGLALYYSLRKYCSNFKLFVLCLSRECYEILKQKRLENIFLLKLEDIERGDDELMKAKSNRTLVEYYFTLTPSFILYVLSNFDEVDFITYLDADLYFFSEPGPIFEEIGENSIAIVPHRFPARLKHLEKFGVYNVSWLSFRRDENGLGCLRWYRERCNEWCYDRVEGDRYADQKYLEKFELLFDGVHVIQHKGANVAPWNIENYKVVVKGSKVYVDDQPLIFYHFQGLKKIFSFLYDSGFLMYGAKFSKEIRDIIYLPYVRMLRQIENELGFTTSPVFKRESTKYKTIQRFAPQLLILLKTAKLLIRLLFTNTFILIR